jgi:glycosyltransferase involved in cell wall biosynthesis
MVKGLSHNALKKKIYLSLFEKRNLRNAAAIHFLVEEEKKDFFQAKLPLRRAIVIPNGLEGGPEDGVVRGFFRQKFGIPSNKKLVLFLGRLHWKKGLDTLIPAFREVIKADRNAVLILAGGDDGYKKSAEELIKKYDIGENVVFTGMILDKEKKAALSESDLFVMPSLFEACSISLLEALSFGLPAIVTEGVGGSLEIQKAQAGLVVKKEAKELSGAILKILDNPDFAKKIGEAGKGLFAQKFLISRVAEEFINSYRELILENAKIDENTKIGYF